VLRVHAILDAAIAVLVEFGADGFNTNRVASTAGIPVGSVYQYFPHKRAVLAGILERGLLDSEHLMRAVARRGAGRPLREVVESGLEGLVELLVPHRVLIGALLREATLLGEESALLMIENSLKGVVEEWSAGRLEGFRPRADPGRWYVTLNGSIFLFLKWVVEQPASVSRREFVSALAAQVTAGLEPER
jgi:AcrR family transcriptional regulator